MQAPPGKGRELPGLVLKNRGDSHKKSQREDRRNTMDNNRYSLLAANQVGDTGSGSSPMDTSEQKQQQQPKPKKPPPIEAFNKKLVEVKKLISECVDITSEVQFRITVTKIENRVRETVKIYTSDNTDFALAKKCLTDNKIEYSTHPLYGDKKLKICMYGLYETSIDDIKNEIKNKINIEPADVKLIRPKKEYTGDSRIYVLYFKRSDKIKVADLRDKITGLFNMRVRFEYFSPRKFGPTQCSNCQDFGHGSENCHRTPKCIRCGGNHTSKICLFLPMDESKPKKINDNLVKCANCKGNHTANYSKCTYRSSFVQK